MPKICRMCLQVIQDLNFVNLNENMDIKEKLSFCFPSMDLHLTPHPFLCKYCLNSLNHSYEFICKCLEVEKQYRTIIFLAPIVEAYSDLDLSSGSSTEQDGSISSERRMEDDSEHSSSQQISLRECRVILTPLEVVLYQTINDGFDSASDNNEDTFRSNEILPIRQCSVILTPIEYISKQNYNGHKYQNREGSGQNSTV